MPDENHGGAKKTSLLTDVLLGKDYVKSALRVQKQNSTRMLILKYSQIFHAISHAGDGLLPKGRVQRAFHRFRCSRLKRLNQQ
ncbi:MAG: hypothetical protein QW728_02675 [Thermoplasmata archaeon]